MFLFNWFTVNTQVNNNFRVVGIFLMFQILPK